VAFLLTGSEGATIVPLRNETKYDGINTPRGLPAFAEDTAARVAFALVCIRYNTCSVLPGREDVRVDPAGRCTAHVGADAYDDWVADREKEVGWG